MPLVRLEVLDTSIQPMFLYFRGLRTICRTDGPWDFNLVGVPDLGMYVLSKTGWCKWPGGALEFLFGVTVPHSDSMSTFYSFRSLISVMAGAGGRE